MMRKEQVISKGKYSHEQPSELMGVKQYLFIKDTDGKKRLLLRFCNYRNERCSKFAFILYRMDAKGRVIGQERYESSDREYYENEVFSFYRKIDVEDRCTDFKVQIIYAVYGNYTYRAQESEVAVSYSDKVPYHAGAAAKARPRKVFHRTFELPWIFAVLSAIILAVGFTVMGILLMDFKDKEDEFTLSGVTYRFVDNQAKDAVVITGCSSTYRDIYLSNEIEGHPVVGIESGAFEKNSNIVSLTIDGINVPNEAFRKCSKLETLVIKNVTSIGSEAFADCDKLETVVITEGAEDQILRIGSAAFGDCGTLKTVEINQTIAYGAQVDFLKDSKNIQTLKLRNFAFAMKGVSSTYVTRLNQLFGYDELDESEARLKTLVIDNIDLIPANFAHGFTKLESVTVTNTSIKVVGENAFKDCNMLSVFDVKGKLVTIGAYAFAGTSITSIDLGNVTSLGKYAFMDASKLATVTGFGSTGIDNIPVGAFYGCKSLTSFVLNPNIKHIYTDAFRGSGLVRFSIPQGVSYDSGILRNCQSLTELEIYELGKASFVGQLFGASRNSTLSQISEFVPAGLKKITLVTGQEISENAFRGCAGVVTIDLPSDIRSIGNSAFENCKKLAEIDIPTDGTTLERIGNFAFAGCESLKLVPLPVSLREIGVGAYSGCNGLESITLLFLGPTPNNDEGNETVSFIFNGTVPTGLKSISLIDTYVVDLPARAFDGCENVEEISIPSTVKTIGENSFRSCEALVTLKYSDSVAGGDGVIDLERITRIGRRAFEGCSELSNLKLNPNVEYLGDYAFSSTGIKEFAVPAGVGYIGEFLLQGCERLESFTAGRMGTDSIGEVTATYFFGNSVPESLKTITVFEFKGDKVTDGAFRGCVGVTTFNLPSATSIGNSAFYGCEALEYLDMSGIESIGDDAFRGCISLTGCDLSDVTYLGSRVFFGTGLTEIVIPEGITALKNDLFNSCKDLKSVTLPESLKSIGTSVFEKSGIETIIIPSSVTAIGRSAFAGSSIVSVDLPSGVINFGTDVFAGCESLKSISFPLTSVFYEMDEYGSNRTIASYLCGGSFPDSLQKITITNASNSYLFENAFFGASSVEEIILCDSITDIESGAFAQCSKLKYISLPLNLSNISSDAFNGCTRLYEVSNPSGCYISIPSLMAETPSLEQRAPMVETSEGYKYAKYNGEWYLVSYPTSESLRLPSEFMYMGEAVIEYSIPKYLFYGDTTLTDVVFPAAIKSVSDYAFYGCSSLTRVDLEGDNTSEGYIGEYAFAGNIALESVKLSSGIKSIGANAFAGCSALTSVTFPTALEEIGEYAFYGCSQLNGVKLYQDVNSIGTGAFAGCDSLYDVYCTSTHLALKAGERGYGDVARNAVKIHTKMSEPLSRVEAISGIGTFRTTDDAWLLISGADVDVLTLAQFVYDKNTVTSYRIAKNAFVECQNLREVVITNAVKQIQQGAFAGLSYLKKVDMSQNSSLNIIEEGTFASCATLRFVILPSSVTEIGQMAFSDCQMLESITMPDSLVTIGNSAFENCSRLVSIVIGKKVESIGTDAFRGCYQLYEVFDLSSALNIVTKESSNGRVAENAYGVFTSTSQGLEKKNCNGAKLIKLPQEDGGAVTYRWYVYSFVDEGADTVKIDGAGTQVVILSYAFVDGNFTKLVLSKDVIRIGGAPFINCDKMVGVYYEGTREEWNSLVRDNYGFSNSMLNFFEKCVHSDSPDNIWTYDEKNGVTKEECKHSEGEALVATTCFSDGKYIYKCLCKDCNYTWEQIEKSTSHEFKGGECTLCKGKEIAIDGTNFQSYVTSGIITVKDFAYDTGKNAFVSQNKAPESESSFRIVAKKAMTVSFTITASCSAKEDYVIVSGEEWINQSVTGTETRTFYAVLSEGEALEIFYSRGANSATENDNCGYIKDLKIVEETTQQSN